MDYLLDYANQNGLRDLNGRIAEREEVQGLILDIEPLWMFAWRLRAAQSSDKQFEDIWKDILERYDRYWRFRNPGNYELNHPFEPWVNLAELTTTLPNPPDLNWSPPYWKELSKNDYKVIAKICLIPGAKPLEIQTENYRMRIVQERRPIAKLASNPKNPYRPLIGGVSIGSDPALSGTLGGVLTDKNGNKFVLTCSHAVKNGTNVMQPSQNDGGTTVSSIGRKTLDSGLIASTKSALCNPEEQNINEMDASLIELYANLATKNNILDVGDIDGFALKRNLSTGFNAEFTGRSSGNQKVVLGGLGVTYKFQDGQNSYCYKNVFELRSPSFLKLALGRPVRGGDSGAWVCIQGEQGTEWCGMIVGEDRLCGYALFSENIMNWLNGHNYHLDCC